MYNVPNSKKKELIHQLINKFEQSSYTENIRRELIDHMRATLKFVTSDSEEVLKRITSTGRVLSFSSSPNENLRNQIQSFERFKSSAISTLNGLLIEIDLIEQFEEISKEESVPTDSSIEVSNHSKEKVFIVHGHDDGLKNEVALFVKRLGLEDIILHERTNRGMTIIEKFEANSDVGFAIVLYTPCDVGRSVSSDNEKPRARQNVIFEHGYFVAKLGRENVVALNKGDVEIPNDLSGMIYTSYEKDDWKRQIAHELEESGYEIDYKSIR